LKVERVESFPPGREREVAQLAYSLDRLSTHPLARATTRYGKQQRLEAVSFDTFESVTGNGLRVGEMVSFLLGKRDWIAGQILRKPLAVAGRRAGLSEVGLLAGDLLGRIVLRDDIRPQAKLVLEELRNEGLHAVVLTGDAKARRSI